MSYRKQQRGMEVVIIVCCVLMFGMLFISAITGGAN